MTPTYNLKKAGAQFSPPRPIKDYPKDSIKKMAVLFTDIVGSSKFFKIQGDIAGRRMLKTHQDMTSPIIREFGGVVVKFLGDSVMAYFLDPNDALKAAIKIQDNFSLYNSQRDNNKQIHIRIGLHYGDGIEEENDIFGDVVNMAAKFLPHVEGDQICISQELKNHVRDLPSISFSQARLKDEKNVLKGLKIFLVTWNNSINLDPSFKTLIVLKPAWEVSKKSLSKVWNNLINTKNSKFPADAIEKESILTDKSIVLVTINTVSSIDIAATVMEYLKVNLGSDGLSLIPVQIVVDRGPFLSAGRISLEQLKVDWSNIMPGMVYISAHVSEKIKNHGYFIFDSEYQDSNNSFFRLIPHYYKNSGQDVFLYTDALIQGELSPCFYCGDRRHHPKDCPSKELTSVTNAIDRLGYYKTDNINRLFFNYLSDPQSKAINADPIFNGRSEESTQLAISSFFELKIIYQLRFLSHLWDQTEENWNKIKETRRSSSQGGLLWIGFDCVRVSNITRAENILKDIFRNKVEDYKAHCIMAFLCIQKSDLNQAKVFFKRALDFTKTAPQKIFVLFQLARIQHLSGDISSAKTFVRKIIRISPYCHEALYLDIIFKFQSGENAKALHQLTKLIRINRDYYIIALIDPDLASYSDAIQPILKQILDQAGEKARQIIPESKDALTKLGNILGDEDKAVLEAKSTFSKIEDLLATESYFGNLDIIHYGESIINMGQKSIEVRHRKLSKILHDLNESLDRSESSVKRLDYPSMTRAVARQIILLRKKVEKDWDIQGSYNAKKYNEILKDLEILSAAALRIRQKLERLENTILMMRFLTKFLKKSVIIQAANFAVALFLLPIAVHYLSFALPSLQLSPHNIWNYQKIVLAFGGISGLILASILTRIDPIRG